MQLMQVYTRFRFAVSFVFFVRPIAFLLKSWENNLRFDLEYFLRMLLRQDLVLSFS
jgi:hypothetical protein